MAGVGNGGGSFFEGERGEGDAKPSNLKGKEEEVPNTAGDDDGATMGATPPGPDSSLEGEEPVIVHLEESIKNLRLEEGEAVLASSSVEQELKGRSRRAAWKQEVKEKMEELAQLKVALASVPAPEGVSYWKRQQVMSNMSLEWREGLKDKRTRFLFNSVFPVIFKTPGLGLTTDDILSCRVVSKDWKGVIDHTLSSTLERFYRYRSESGAFHQQDYPQCFHSITNMAEVTAFNNWSQERYSGDNPFFARKLNIELIYDENSIKYWAEVETMLKRWGQELWLVILTFHNVGNVEVMYGILRKFLSLIPNVRDLSINDADRSEFPEVKILRDLGEDEFPQLRDRIANYPPPELAQLQNLYIDHYVPASVTHAILDKYGKSLETVIIGGERRLMDPGKFLVGKSLPNLRQASLVAHQASHSTYELPALKELTLEFYGMKERAEVVNMFKTLNSCGSTLRELRLFIEFEIMPPLAQQPDHFLTGEVRLELPKLEWMQLFADWTNLRNIDFLLPLKSLKELTIHCQKFILDFDSESKNAIFPEGVIQFSGCMDRLYESNIWTLLPELKMAVIHVKTVLEPSSNRRMSRVLSDTTTTYTRKGYMKHSGGAAVGDLVNERGEVATGSTMKLEQDRRQSLSEIQIARKKAWKEETGREIEKLTELKNTLTAVPQDKITNWKDKLARLKISLEGREKLKDQRTRVLFSSVFPIILQTPVIAVNHILSCRRVCKDWKEMIEDFISTTTDSVSTYRERSGIFKIYYFPLIIHRFFKEQNLAEFNRWSEVFYRKAKLGNNPFFSRKLLIGFPAATDYRNNMGYWNQMEKLLRRRGKEIWQTSIFFQKGMGMAVMYEMLVQYLSLMPNLRRLSIFDQDHTGRLEVEMMKDLGKDIYGPLKDGMTKTPLPALAHLHTILFNDAVPAPLIQAMFSQYGNTLESITVMVPSREDDDQDVRNYVPTTSLPLLKHLCINSSTCVMSHLNPGNVPPLLEEMCLEYTGVNTGEEVENIFETVNGCASTLRRLRMSILFQVSGPPANEPDLMITGAKLELALPRLEWIHLTVSRTNLSNIDFLLPLVSLKELDLSYDNIVSEDDWAKGKGKVKGANPAFHPSKEIIQFQGYQDRFNQSNIWKLLPELRLVCIKVTTFIERVKSEGVLQLISLDVDSQKTTVYTREGRISKVQTSSRTTFIHHHDQITH